PGVAVGVLEAWPATESVSLDPPGYEEPYAAPAPVAKFVLPPIDSNPVAEGPAIAAPEPLALPDDNSDETIVASVDPGPSDPSIDIALAEPQPSAAEIIELPPVASEDVEEESVVTSGVGLFSPPQSPLAAADASSLEDLNDPAARLAKNATSAELMLDAPAPGRISQLVAPDVQKAFALGSHGALYAAKQRFIGVLRRVALAKDAELATNQHSAALAAGLRALDEAEQFIPRGKAVEAELNVAQIAASHSTPLYRQDDNAKWVLPSEAVARYHRYAQHKLAAAVAGNQGGSMALHGLGKTFTRIADIDEDALAQRTSMTMYRAAVESHPGNYLAANELGVGLAKAGHYGPARETLEKAIATGGGSTVYRNLAVVQQGLGQPQLAAAANARAEQLAARERANGEFSRQQGVQWVDREQLARVGDTYGRSTPRQAAAPPPARVASSPPLTPQQAAEPRPSIADRLMPWRRPSAKRSTPSLAPTTPSNRTAPPVRSQTIVR
ncbi:MAG: hypothetical protein AAF589_06410, partial [Planctomycetota bacterium]